jgi:hypothetical protein
VHAAGDLGVVESLPPSALHLFFDVFSGLRDDLLYAARMDAPVLHQLLHRYTSDLAPHRVEAGDNHRLRRIVNYHINPRSCLESPDVPPLAPDHTPLHII